MDLKTKETILILLYRMANSDNNVSEKEKSFIQNIMIQFPEIDVDNLRDRVHIPEDEQERMTILYYLLFIIKCDRQITPEEIEFINKITIRLGFRPEMTNQMLSVVEKHLDTPLPPHKLINVIKTYLN